MIRQGVIISNDRISLRIKDVLPEKTFDVMSGLMTRVKLECRNGLSSEVGNLKTSC